MGAGTSELSFTYSVSFVYYMRVYLFVGGDGGVTLVPFLFIYCPINTGLKESCLLIVTTKLAVT